MDDLQYIANIELLEIADEPVQARNVFQNLNPFEVLSEQQFIKTFRVSKELGRYIVDLLTPLMRPQRRATDLSIEIRVLVAIRFFGSGGYQMDIGLNIFLSVSQPSASRCIEEVSAALNTPGIFNLWVRFPRNFEEMNAVRLKFYEDNNFPGVIGCIDCTHVSIHTPKINDEEYPEHLYVNRKGYHSINVQLICDSQMKLTNVIARYPGSTHDSFIWANSNVLQLLRNLHAGGHFGYYLLGDSGYPQRTWLMKPLEYEPLIGTPEYNYNRSQRSTRNKIETCKGLLKMRFRCLHKDRVLHYKPDVACRIINACVVLHNMCIQYNVPLQRDNDENIDLEMFNNEDDNENQLEDQLRRINPELRAGRQARERLIRNFFAL